MIVIALEGPSCVGKTTTLARLIYCLAPTGVNLLHFPCYSDAFENGGPKARSGTTQEQLDAFATFMRVEKGRVDSVRQTSPPPDLVVLDRSVDTLLAHCKAVDSAMRSSSYASARRELVTLPHLTPDLTIYFDCPFEIIQSRAGGERSSLDEFFLNSSFLRNFPLHFNNPDDVIARSVRHIDATQPLSVVSSEIANMIISILGNTNATTA
jgi:dTMP kinase